MNRREFAKALAGIPLLGLLAKLPKAKDPYHEIDVLTFNGASQRVEGRANILFDDWEAEKMRDPEFRAIAEELEPAYEAARGGVLDALRSSGLPMSNEDSFYTTSSNATRGPILTYWDGQGWIPMGVSCSKDWYYTGDKHQ